MKRWAVGYVDCYDNTLTIEIISAETWDKALIAHSMIGSRAADMIDTNSLGNTAQKFFDCDSLVDVVEITTIEIDPLAGL